ncbi:unnamed protein product [Closterium sp. NIES-54]
MHAPLPPPASYTSLLYLAPLVSPGALLLPLPLSSPPLPSHPTPPTPSTLPRGCGGKAGPGAAAARWSPPLPPTCRSSIHTTPSSLVPLLLTRPYQVVRRDLSDVEARREQVLLLPGGADTCCPPAARLSTRSSQPPHPPYPSIPARW